jgi:polyhydroxyalkanoate synthesis regulator phasin
MPAPEIQITQTDLETAMQDERVALRVNLAAAMRTIGELRAELDNLQNQNQNGTGDPAELVEIES